MRERYINEECSICGDEFENVEGIFVDEETDNYVCERCSRKYGLVVNEIGSYSEDEI